MPLKITSLNLLLFLVPISSFSVSFRHLYHSRRMRKRCAVTHQNRYSCIPFADVIITGWKVMVNQSNTIHSCKEKSPLQEGWEDAFLALGSVFCTKLLKFISFSLERFQFLTVCCKCICRTLLCKGIQLWQEAFSIPATSEAEVQILREIPEGWNQHWPQIMYKILRQACCLLSSPIYPVWHSATHITKEKAWNRVCEVA